VLLPDFQIERGVERHNLIEPFDKDCLQPASYDCKLSNEFIYVNPPEKEIKAHPDVEEVVDPLNLPNASVASEWMKVKTEWFVIMPGQFVLASTQEFFNFPSHTAGRVEGKSSLGRLGLLVHVTAGFFDPGFKGTATLEIVNLLGRPIILKKGMKICQMSFLMLASEVSKMYDGQYQGDKGAAVSRYKSLVGPVEEGQEFGKPTRKEVLDKQLIPHATIDISRME